jgi:hypothetical protein
MDPDHRLGIWNIVTLGVSLAPTEANYNNLLKSIIYSNCLLREAKSSYPIKTKQKAIRGR